jgi:hypothetical protein
VAVRTYLFVVAVPAAYLYWALVNLCLEAINNLEQPGDDPTIAFLIVLILGPAGVWAGSYLYHARLAGRSSPAVAALYATLLMFPATVMALMTRLWMGGGL